MLNWTETGAAHLHGTFRDSLERIEGDKADLIALYKQLKDCPVEESLDLFGLVPEGRIWNFISDDGDGWQILA